MGESNNRRGSINTMSTDIITIESVDPEAVGAELAKVEQSSNLAEDSAMALRGQFADYYGSIIEWREKAALVTKPDDVTHQKIAREVRLGLRRVRCEVENTRKTLKADSLARGKAIDGFANVLKYLCEPIEDRLLAVEQHAERMEAARIAALVAERTAALVAVEADPTAYNLGVMDETTFALVLAGAKKSREDRIEAARVEEAERVAREQADAKERDRLKVENERLKKQEEERQAELDNERARAKKAEQDAADARKRESDRIAAEKAKEAKRVKDAQEAADRATRAPDKEKLLAFSAALRTITTGEMTTEVGRALARCAKNEVLMVAAKIEKQAEGM